ncbi:hypothetical protein HAX54_040311 [Datura stramonium]|uniref:Uncharacterized protein n=1 Tax=Datura stramonium TaxID=4076 RepID=A0ABS8VNT0_DATST|nr:hypothetical protein [Datura stramonium]
MALFQWIASSFPRIHEVFPPSVSKGLSLLAWALVASKTTKHSALLTFITYSFSYTNALPSGSSYDKCCSKALVDISSSTSIMALSSCNGGGNISTLITSKMASTIHNHSIYYPASPL